MTVRTAPFALLFVCSGNTCRSPLAEVIARRSLEQRGWSQVEVQSAGTGAGAGSPASSGSLEAAERHGLDLTGHRSQVLGAGLVAHVDLVLCMDEGHLRRAVGLGGEEKAALLSAFASGRDDPADGPGVQDPFGGGTFEYERTYAELEELVEEALDRLAPLVAP